MNTTQNKITGQIGPIQINNRGFFIDPALIPQFSSKDILENFLLVDSTNEDEIDEFCRNNVYIPRDISLGWRKAFQIEQDEVRAVAEKISQGIHGNTELQIIVEKLKDMATFSEVVTEKKLYELNTHLYWNAKNTPLESAQTPNADSNTNVVIDVKHHITAQHSIWDTLLSILKQKRSLRQCADYITCRRFFFPHKRRPDQKYCSPECEDRVRKRINKFP